MLQKKVVKRGGISLVRQLLKSNHYLFSDKVLIN